MFSHSLNINTWFIMTLRRHIRWRVFLHWTTLYFAKWTPSQWRDRDTVMDHVGVHRRVSSYMRLGRRFPNTSKRWLFLHIQTLGCKFPSTLLRKTIMRITEYTYSNSKHLIFTIKCFLTMKVVFCVFTTNSTGEPVKSDETGRHGH